MLLLLLYLLLIYLFCNIIIICKQFIGWVSAVVWLLAIQRSFLNFFRMCSHLCIPFLCFSSLTNKVASFVVGFRMFVRYLHIHFFNGNLSQRFSNIVVSVVQFRWSFLLCGGTVVCWWLFTAVQRFTRDYPTFHNAMHVLLWILLC